MILSDRRHSPVAIGSPRMNRNLNDFSYMVLKELCEETNEVDINGKRADIKIQGIPVNPVDKPLATLYQPTVESPFITESMTISVLRHIIAAIGRKPMGSALLIKPFQKLRSISFFSLANFLLQIRKLIVSLNRLPMVKAETISIRP